jgi:hypothetical protein
VNKLVPNYEKPLVSIRVEHAENGEEAEVSLSYKGREFNPFAEPDSEDDISMRILRKIVKDHAYSFSDGGNKLSFKI